jgi:hypothetical protein
MRRRLAAQLDGVLAEVGLDRLDARRQLAGASVAVLKRLTEGDTALTRTAMGSTTAARTKASTAAFTVVIIAPPGIGCCASTPVVSVIAPPARTYFAP